MQGEKARMKSHKDITGLVSKAKMMNTGNNQHITASVCKIYDGVQIDHLSMRILGGYPTFEDFTAIDELKECRVI